MSLKSSTSKSSQWVHWIVLLALLLGQFVLGFGYGFAAQKNNDEIRIPICTSNGIEYIIWSADGPLERTDASKELKSSTCVLCTVSPTQIRFNTQDDILPKAARTQTARAGLTENRCKSIDLLALNAAPRAPPRV
jgi:hypothetical protein